VLGVGRDRLDVARPQPVLPRVDLALDDGGVRDDRIVDAGDEVDAAHRVLEVVLVERLVRLRPRGGEDRAEGPELTRRELGAPHATDRDHACGWSSGIGIGLISWK
jgi:hypothetical protein